MECPVRWAKIEGWRGARRRATHHRHDDDHEVGHEDYGVTLPGGHASCGPCGLFHFWQCCQACMHAPGSPEQGCFLSARLGGLAFRLWQAFGKLALVLFRPSAASCWSATGCDHTAKALRAAYPSPKTARQQQLLTCTTTLTCHLRRTQQHRPRQAR